MFGFINKIKLWYRHQKLIKDGILMPVESYGIGKRGKG